MKDRLVTIVLSVACTLALTQGVPRAISYQPRVLEVDRLVVRQELIVSDTGQPWEPGFEKQQIPRGLYARSVGKDVGGLWVRSRLIKGEIDDPFDDRFHALERDGSMRRAPGHVSWNVWIDGAWRQMAIIQGEGLEFSEVPQQRWSGYGRLHLSSHGRERYPIGAAINPGAHPRNAPARRRGCDHRRGPVPGWADSRGALCRAGWGGSPGVRRRSGADFPRDRPIPGRKARHCSDASLPGDGAVRFLRLARQARGSGGDGGARLSAPFHKFE